MQAISINYHSSRAGARAAARLCRDGRAPDPARGPGAARGIHAAGQAVGHVSSLPRLLSHLAIAFDGEVGKQRPGPHHLISIIAARFPRRRRRSCPTWRGRSANAPRDLGQGPDLRAHHPATPPLARPIRHRRPPLIPGPDQGSREGGVRIMGEGGMSGDESAPEKSPLTLSLVNKSAKLLKSLSPPHRGRSGLRQRLRRSIHAATSRAAIPEPR